VSFLEIRGLKRELNAIRDKLQGLIRSITADERDARSEAPDDAERYRFTLAFYPLPEQKLAGDQTQACVHASRQAARILEAAAHQERNPVGEVTLDRQQATEICEHCREPITVSRGSVYDDGRPAGLYLAGMHRCDVEPVAIVALALMPPEEGQPQAVHLHVRGTSEAVEMVLQDPQESPWRAHHYLGRMLTPAEARQSPLRDRFFHVAHHVVTDLPEVRAFLARSE
jgi:hypothetical protein